jgi:hypothetical protein
MLLDDIAVLAEECAWLDDFDGLVQALSRRLRNTYRIRVRQRLVTNVKRLVEIGVEAVMVDRYVDVEDIAVFEYALVWNAVADDLVERCAYGLGEVTIVERRRVGLFGSAHHCIQSLQPLLHRAQ